MKQKKSGFTLVEMLVVMLFIGIMTVLSVSIGKSIMQRTSYTNAVNTLVSDISLIKQLAAKENRYYAIEFLNDGASYKIERQTTIGNLANWTDVSTIQPLDGAPCFDGTIVTGAWKGFAINPMGVVFTLPFPAAPATVVPASQNFYFHIINKHSGQTDYRKNIQIYSNGGIKIGQ
jgi:prepilin-type N-terminal cleavage/methylation domain-containing protein